MDPDFEPMHITITHDDCKGNGLLGRFWILPGSMERAKSIAEKYLTDAVVRSSGRGHHAHIGTLRSEEGTVDIGIVSTGMGAPSVDIIVTELIKLGGKVLVRVGTAGAMSPNLAVGDLVVASGAVRDEGTTRHYMPLEFPALADPAVVTALNGAAAAEQESGDPEADTWVCESGPVHTKDTLMAREFKFGPLAEDHKKYMTTLEDLGCLASEMECSMLFTLGQVYRVKAGAVLSIIGGGSNPFSDDASKKSEAVDRACRVTMKAMGPLKKRLDRSASYARGLASGGASGGYSAF